MDADLAVNQADAVHEVADPVGAEADLQGIPVPKLIGVLAVVLHVVGDFHPHIQVLVVPGKARVAGDVLAPHGAFLADAGDLRPVDVPFGRGLDRAVEGDLAFKHALGTGSRLGQDIHLRIGLPGRHVAGQGLHGEVELADLAGVQGERRDRGAVGKEPGGGGVGKGKGEGHRFLCDVFNRQLHLPAVLGIHRSGRNRRVVADGRHRNVGAVDLTGLGGKLHLGRCVLRIDVVGYLDIVRAVNAHRRRLVVRHALAGAEVVVKDLDVLRAVDVQRVVGVAVNDDVVLDQNILMHQHRRVGARRAVARNGDGAGDRLVAVEAGVLKDVVGDLEVGYIAAFVPSVVDFRLDQHGGHADVADGAVGDRPVGRLEQEAAGAGGVDQAVVKQEARAVGGKVLNQRAVL